MNLKKSLYLCSIIEDMKRTTTHPGDVLKDIEIASNHKNCLGKESGNKYALFFDIEKEQTKERLRMDASPYCAHITSRLDLTDTSLSQLRYLLSVTFLSSSAILAMSAFVRA